MFEAFKIIRNSEFNPKIGVVLNGWIGKFKGNIYGNYENNCVLTDNDWKEQSQETYNALLKNV